MDDCRKYPGREVDTVDVREPNWIVRRHCTAGPLPQPPPSPGARDAVLNGCRSCLCLALSFFNSTYLYHGCCLKTNNIRHNPAKIRRCIPVTGYENPGESVENGGDIFSLAEI